MTDSSQTLIDREYYGPWAVIAGGSDGTGAAFAHVIAASGISLLLIARRQAPLDAIAAELRDLYGVEVRTLIADLNLPDAAAKIIEATRDLEVGLYVSNAGAGTGGTSFADSNLDTLHALVQCNILTLIDTCHHFVQGMRARGRGGIVLMGSGAGVGGQPGVAVYSGVKGFVLNLAESLWSELRDLGVHVIAIAAPVMETPSFRRSHGDKAIPGIFSAEEVVRTTFERLPVGASYIYAFGSPPEESERQTQVRRDRILWVEGFSKALFVKE